MQILFFHPPEGDRQHAAAEQAEGCLLADVQRLAERVGGQGAGERSQGRGITVHIEGAVSATLFLGASANPELTLEHYNTTANHTGDDFRFQVELLLQGSLSGTGGLGMYKICGVRLTLSIGIEAGYNRLMPVWYPLATEWGFTTALTITGTFEMARGPINFSYDFASFSWPLPYGYGFMQYYADPVTGETTGLAGFLADYGGQRFLPSPIPTQEDPPISDLTVCEGYNDLAAFAFTADTDQSLETTDDRDLFVQFYRFSDHSTYVPVKVAGEQAQQDLVLNGDLKTGHYEAVDVVTEVNVGSPRLVRNGGSTFLFWREDSDSLKYLDVSGLLNSKVLDGEDEAVLAVRRTNEDGGYYFDPEDQAALSQEGSDHSVYAVRADGSFAVDAMTGKPYAPWVQQIIDDRCMGGLRLGTILPPTDLTTAVFHLKMNICICTKLPVCVILESEYWALCRWMRPLEKCKRNRHLRTGGKEGD